MTPDAPARTSSSTLARWGRRRRVLAVGSLLALIVAACTSGDDDDADPADDTADGEATASEETGVTDDELVISVVMGFSGPTGEVLESAFQGFETAVEDVNDGGGIHGRRIRVEKVDHLGTADGGVAACREVQSNGSFMAAVLEGTVANVSAVDCLDDAGIPTVFANEGNPEWTSGFTYLATTSSQGAAVARVLADDGQHADDAIGVVYVNNQAFQGMYDGFISGADEAGLDVAAEQSIEFQQASVTAELQRFKDEGIETVVVFASIDAPSAWRDAAAIDYQPYFTGGGYVFDFALAAAGEQARGVSGVAVAAGNDTDAYADYAEAMEARGRGRPPAEDNGGFIIYGAAQLIAHMLDTAGEQPTRDSFVSGAESIADFETGILPPVTFGSNDHIATTSAFYAECCSDDLRWQTLEPVDAGGA